MGLWSKVKKAANTAVNVGTLGATNALGITHGEGLKDITNDIGVTNPAPPDISKNPDVESARALANHTRNAYLDNKTGTYRDVEAPSVSVSPVTAAMLDSQRESQARAEQQKNIEDQRAVLEGRAPSAAEGMFTRGADVARKNMAGLAAAYSRGNPGLALRAGLASGEQAASEMAAPAAVAKAQEMARARDSIGALAAAMRGADINTAEANQTATNNMGQFNAKTGLEAAEANQKSSIESQGMNQRSGLEEQNLNNQMEINRGKLALDSAGLPISADEANLQNQLKNQQNNQEGLGSVWTTIGGAMKSDERVKEDIRPMRALADALAKGVHGVTFKYKPGHEDGGRHAGVIAQEVETVIPGVVKKDGTGTKVVDTGHLSLANTGILSDLARRLRALEARA